MPEEAEFREIVYTAQSLVRRPGQLLRATFGDLIASRGLVWRLVVRNIQGQYRRALLGAFWAFLPSIAMATTFTLARNANVINVGTTDIPYPAYVLFSMTLWQTFVEALNAPILALRTGQSLLTRVKFPRETLVLAKLGEVIVNLGTKLILLVLMFLAFQIAVPATLALAPLALLLLIVLGAGIGLWLAPLSGLYDDVARTLTLLTGLWMFLTPVVYPVPREGLFSWIVFLNPVTHLLVTTRELATIGVMSSTIGFWIVGALAIFTFLAGWLIFRLSIPFVVERMGN